MAPILFPSAPQVNTIGNLHQIEEEDDLEPIYNPDEGVVSIFEPRNTAVNLFCQSPEKQEIRVRNDVICAFKGAKFALQFFF